MNICREALIGLLLILCLVGQASAHVSHSVRPKLRSEKVKKWAEVRKLDIDIREKPNDKVFEEDEALKFSVLHRSGGDSSGGGFVYKRSPGKLWLLDYALFLDDLAALPQSATLRGEPLGPFKPHYSVVGFQRVSPFFFTNFSFYHLLKARLELWEKSSPLIIGFLREAFESIRWRLTPYYIKKPEAESNIWTAVLYSDEVGAWLSAPLFDQLNDLTRAGLFLHESFRHMKVIYDDELSEELIFYLTSKIMLTLPKSGETLDDVSLFSPGSLIAGAILERHNLLALQSDFDRTLEELIEAIDQRLSAAGERKTLFSKWAQRLKEVSMLDSKASGLLIEVMTEMEGMRFTPTEFQIASLLYADLKNVLQRLFDIKRMGLGPALNISAASIGNSFGGVATSMRIGPLLDRIDDYETTGEFFAWTEEDQAQLDALPDEDWVRDIRKEVEYWTHLSPEETEELKKSIEELKQITQEKVKAGVFIEPRDWPLR